MSYYLLNKQVLFSSQSGKITYLADLRCDQLRSNEWKLLQLFIDNIGEDLSSSQILEEVWQGKRAKSSVATSIKNLRIQLGDSADTPRFIQTQVMSGYAFIGSAKKLTQEQYDSYLVTRASWQAKCFDWLTNNKSSAVLYALNVISLLAIIVSGNSLYRNGAFERYLAPSVAQKIVPMQIEGSMQNAEINLAVCQGLLAKAQRSSSLQQLPVGINQEDVRFPSLFWSDSNREVILCRLSPTK